MSRHAGHLPQLRYVIPARFVAEGVCIERDGVGVVTGGVDVCDELGAARFKRLDGFFVGFEFGFEGIV
jgi:hypothetical protein